jgi:exosome complex component RRP43
MHEIDINKATQPYEYYLKFIKQNCRPDQRRLSDIRPYTISAPCINTVNGSAMCKLGATVVLCGISARLARPKEERPAHGYVLCNVELPALCSAKNSKHAAISASASFSQSSVSSASTEQTQSMLTQLMQDVLAESKCISEADLCIKEGKLVWALYIDLVCLNNDGNVQDACCVAMVAALKTVKLNQVEFDEATSRPVVTWPAVTRPLTLTCEPVCTTLFALEDNILLSDPNRSEEDFMRSFLIVCTVDGERMCLVRKLGGFGLSGEQIGLCVKRALENGIYVRENYLKFV